MPDHDSHSALLEVAHAFRPRIIAERDHIEAARRIPEGIAQDLAGAGFFRIFLPEVYGGLDLTPVQAMEVFEELARADLRAVQLLFGHTKLESTVRYLGIEVDDALAISEQVEL